MALFLQMVFIGFQYCLLVVPGARGKPIPKLRPAASQIQMLRPSTEFISRLIMTASTRDRNALRPLRKVDSGNPHQETKPQTVGASSPTNDRIVFPDELDRVLAGRWGSAENSILPDTPSKGEQQSIVYPDMLTHGEDGSDIIDVKGRVRPRGRRDLSGQGGKMPKSNVRHTTP